MIDTVLTDHGSTESRPPAIGWEELQVNIQPHACPDAAGPLHVARMGDAARRQTIVLRYRELLSHGSTESRPTLRQAAKQLGTSAPSLCRWNKQYDGTLGSLLDDKHKCGVKSKFPKLTEEEMGRLRQIFGTSNKAEDAGSMMTSAKFFALESGCRDELRDAILPVLESGRVPQALVKVFERVTPTHFASKRRPGMTATENFSGQVGAFVGDKIKRLRVIESDDGTLNFAAWIPWAMGGDPCSDRFQVRLARWQFLPAVEAGWTYMYLGYALVCRPKSSYRNEDIRSLIYTIAQAHGLPDKFRFERGAWESDNVVRLIKDLGVELDTVYQSNQKPIVEGGFNSLWTNLSMLDGQVGRYRGDEEMANKLLQACRAGRRDPRDHFPSLAQCVKGLDGAMAMRNSDKINSIYGKWIPEERHQLLNAQRPWQKLPPEMEFLFTPYVKEWTVAKGTVGGDIPILEDYNAPFYFAHEDLWRWNGRKVRVYFDHKASPCFATILATEDYHGYKPNELICRAELLPGLPHFCRAARGWADEQCERQVKWRGAALSALRTERRALGPRGAVIASVSEQRDGSGSFARVESGSNQGSTESHPTESRPTVQIVRSRAAEAVQPISAERGALLARQAQLSRAMMEEDAG